MATSDMSLVLPTRVGKTDDSQDGISLGQIFGTMWRRRWLFAATFVGLVGLGFGIVKLLTPSFTSEVIFILSVPQDGVVNTEQTALLQPPPDGAVRSEGDAMQSRTLINRVVEREHLIDDPEFNPYAVAYKPNLLMRLGLTEHLPQFVRHFVENRPMDSSFLTPDQVKYYVATQVNKNYSVSLDTKTYTVKMDFTSVDSEKAARIASAFAEEYLDLQLAERLAEADRAAKWLSPRLSDLSHKVEAADGALQDYMAANHIVSLPSTSDPTSNTLALQEVQTASQALATAQASAAQLGAAQQELQRITADPSDALSAPTVAAAPVVENIRLQEVAAAAHVSELLGTYGDKHPMVIDARNALATLQSRLGAAVQTAIKQLGAQLAEARATEQQAQARLDNLTKVRNGENLASPRMLQLESELDAAKLTYNTFVQGFYRAMTQDGVPAPRGRIVQYAQPLDSPSFPNLLIFMAVIAAVAMMSAVATVFAVEARDRSFRAADQVEAEIGMRVLGTTLLAANRFPMLPLPRRETSVSHRLLASPTSALSESIRHARTALLQSSVGEAPKVVMVTSALPGEGKTTFSLMLARSSAQHSSRVLAIEADLRKSSFERELPGSPAKGLADYLRGEAELEEIVGIDAASGAHFIPAGNPGGHSGNLLGSSEMRSLIERASEKYDLVVIDTPPASVTADALQLGDVVDAAVLVVKWGETPRHLVIDAARKLRAANVPIAGSVLTQVDARRYGSYGRGKLPYHYAREYYGS